MNTIDRDAIRKRIANCRTYNFGMRDADALAHEDAPAMLALLDAQPAGWAVDREALMEALHDVGGIEGAINSGMVADAVIAHLALSAQEAATDIEPEGDKYSSGEHRKVMHQRSYVCDTCINVLGINIRWDQAPCRKEVPNE